MAEPLWTSEEIAKAVGGKLAGPAFSATGVSIDTRTLEPGDRVILSSADGRTAAYTVTARRQYPKSALPTGLVFDQDTTPRLVLVTCGGSFDREPVGPGQGVGHRVEARRDHGHLAERARRDAGILEPAYGVAGDSFDYAINDNIVHLAVIDAMGHGLNAAILATLAISAYRHARRANVGLADLYGLMDAAIDGQFGPDQFVTAPRRA